MEARPSVVALCLLLAGAGAVEAQTRRPSMLPAETPPTDFAETQYVDSRGCAFVRAALNGQVTWLPQFDEERQQLCGLEPSLVGGPAAPARVVIRETPEEEEVPEEPRADAPDPDEPEMAADPSGPTTPQDEDDAPESAPESRVVILAEGGREAAPRHMLRVIERRGSVIELQPDPQARSVLTVIDQRGSLYYPDT